VLGLLYNFRNSCGEKKTAKERHRYLLDVEVVHREVVVEALNEIIIGHRFIYGGLKAKTVQTIDSELAFSAGQQNSTRHFVA